MEEQRRVNEVSTCRFQKHREVSKQVRKKLLQQAANMVTQPGSVHMKRTRDKNSDLEPSLKYNCYGKNQVSCKH